MDILRQLNHQTLKTHHRQTRENFPQSLSLRVHRALSWLNRAEQEPETATPDSSSYGSPSTQPTQTTSSIARISPNEKSSKTSSAALIDRDADKLLYELVWDQFSGAIRLLIDNQYVFQPFWDYHNGRTTEEQWQQAFQNSKAAALRAIGHAGYPKGDGHHDRPPVHLTQSALTRRRHLEQQHQPQPDIPGC